MVIMMFMIVLMILKTKIFQSRSIPREEEYKIIVIDRTYTIDSFTFIRLTWTFRKRNVFLAEGPLSAQTFDSKEEKRCSVYIM